MDTSNLEEEMKQISELDEEIDEDVLEPQKPKSAITLSKVSHFIKMPAGNICMNISYER